MEQRDVASSSSASVTGDNRDAEAGAEPEASSSGNRESDPVAASVSSPFDTRGEGVGEEEAGRGGRFGYDFGHQEIIAEESQREQERQNFFGIPYRGNFFVFDDSSAVRDDSWSCIIVVLTFWFFVSMTLILGVYGPESLSLGPFSSVLIEPNPIFVQSIQVEGLDDTVNPGLVLYGLYESPSLDVAKTWFISHNASVPYDSHKEWIYFLNKGSQINITYNLSSASSSVFLVIAEGSDGLAQWLDDPTYPNTTLSWNVIRGSGTVEQHIYTSTSYYIAVGNLNSDDIEVHLDLSVRSFIYNTTDAYNKCSIADGACGLSILFPTGNSVVLTSPGPEEASSNDGWDVKVSYGPRWATYIVGVAGMTVLMLAAFSFLNNVRCYREEESGVNYRLAESERAPLLQYKDDDLSSWGSYYDSVSSDEKDIEEFLAANGIEGKPSRDGENGNNTRRLCAICYDAPRDCFFLPCGHCVACFECGTRIANVAGTCPVCQRDMKKVRKIFTV